ncbi:MAG: PEGA domain-containing protein [Deltaproteobacteria bacterium]|nr:PEGA domain-containing protein [Deltaproteobacteria bacterium]
MSRILAALAIALSIAAYGAYASAQEVSDADKAKAKELFIAGVKLFKKDQHAQALEKFQASYELRPHWRLHLNIGLCFKELSMYTKAKAEFDSFLQKGADKMDDAALEQVFSELEKLKEIIAVLSIDVLTPGATVKLDGKEVGTSPILGPIEVNPGSHVLEVLMEGHEPYRVEFLLSKGEQKDFTMTLEALPEEKPVTPVGPFPEDEKKKTRGKAAPAFWAMGGLTLALAGGATAMGILTIKKKQELDDLDESTQDSYPGGYTPAGHSDYLDERKEIQDDGKLFGILTTSLMAAAGAALVATVVAGVITHPFAPREGQPEGEPPPETATPGVALQIAPVPINDGAMLMVGGTF